MTVSTVRLPAPDLPAGPRSALVIATTTYDDPSLRQLRAPATDAAELAAVLANPRIGAFEVTEVVDRSEHEVRLAIDEFLDGRTPEEMVVVYFSCHGVTDAWRRLYFAATDTFKSRLAATGVDSMWVNDRMEKCRARRQVLILDCCFSGAFARGAKGAEAPGLDQLTEQGRGRVVLTASNANEYSFIETPTTGQPIPDSPAPGSIFTAALLAGLRDGSADRDGDGFVTVDEAYAYADQQVRASGAAQTPQRWLSGGEGQLLLARNPAGRPVIPAALPESLRAALDNRWPNVRIGAVEQLRDWPSDDPARVVTAIRELEDVADNDVQSVAAAARSALGHLRPPGPTSPPGGSTRQPGLADADQDHPPTSGASTPTPPQPPDKVGKWILAAAVLSLLLSMFLPFYTYIARTGLAEELRPIVDDWTRMRVIPSIVFAIAAFICELRVRLHRGALGFVACAAFLVIWESIIVTVSNVDLRVGFFFYLVGGLLLLSATVTIWAARRRAFRTKYLIRWPYVLLGSVFLLVPLVWRLSLTAIWSLRLYAISIAIAAALTIVPKHITDARRDASLTAFAALAVAQLAFPFLGLLRFHDLFLLQYGGLVELGSAACVWIVLIRAQQERTQEVVPATSSS